MASEGIVCKSLNEIFEILMKINNIKDNSGNKHLYFRGEKADYDYRTPSLYREEKLAMYGSEYYYKVLLNELGKDDYQSNTSLVRLIAELQHYGAKTRLLDITRNPLIALYFATEGKDDSPGYLYIYEVGESDEKFDTGHTIAVKTALNLMPQKVVNNFLDAMEDIENSVGENEFENLAYCALEKLRKTLEEKSNQPKETLEKWDETISRFMELLNQRARVRERLVFPIKIYTDLKVSHIVLPAKTTDRIRQQQGAFIYPRFVSSTKEYDNIKKEISESIDTLSVKQKRLKIENKQDIRKDLALMGINEGFVFSDIEHQSEALLKQMHTRRNETY